MTSAQTHLNALTLIVALALHAAFTASTQAEPANSGPQSAAGTLTQADGTALFPGSPAAKGIYLCEFDGPRARKVHVKIIKEG